MSHAKWTYVGRDDADIGLIRASTDSLSHSVLEEIDENGRTYCSDDYYMPNDEAEQTRLSITHQAFLQILDGQLTMSRIPADIKRVLDVGTGKRMSKHLLGNRILLTPKCAQGTGDWATAFGERFPECEVIATDIATFQPMLVHSWVFFPGLVMV